MTRFFGVHGTAINRILAYLATDAGVSNADKIEQDGALGTQFQTALAELKVRQATYELARIVRQQAAEVRTSANRQGMHSPLWGEPYDRFVAYLNRGASTE